MTEWSTIMTHWRRANLQPLTSVTVIISIVEEIKVKLKLMKVIYSHTWTLLNQNNNNNNNMLFESPFAEISYYSAGVYF